MILVFIGFCVLGQPLSFPVLTEVANVPTEAAALPTYRVYGSSGLQVAGTGSLTLKESAALTGATNASPIVITSAAHGLTSGMKITIAGVLGNTAANGTFTITVIDANTFSLGGSTGNAPYTSGGIWHTTGYVKMDLTPTSGNGYSQGEYYDILVVASVGGNVVEYCFRFGVI